MATFRFLRQLSESWTNRFGRNPAALRTTSAFYRIIRQAAEDRGAVLSLLDVDPNLAVITRATLLSADYWLDPLAADLFSLQGLKNLGPTIRSWKDLGDARATFPLVR